MALIPRVPTGYRLFAGEFVNTLVDALNTLISGSGVVSDLTAATLTATRFSVGVNGDATARAGGGQASATQLSPGFTVVATVATGADSVKLPAGSVGLTAIVRNSGANSMQVFGNGTDTINGVATGTGVAQAANTTAVYVCKTAQPAAAWFRVLSA